MDWKNKACRIPSAALLLLTIAVSAKCRADVTVYPSPPETQIKRNADFTAVEVRPVGSTKWQKVAVYDHESSFAGHAGIAAFGMSSPAEVRVTFKYPITAAAVLPSRRLIKTRLGGDQLTFTIPKSQNLVINVNGDKDHPLCLFANPLEAHPPRPDDPDVDYYAPGTVTPYRKTVKKHIYIAGGAVVKGAIDLTSGMTLDGCGMLYTDINTNPLKSWQADTITVRNVIVYNFGPGLWKQGNWTFLAYATTHLTVDNVKFFDVFYGEDGIDLDGASHDVAISNCFFHVADDCISPKSTQWQANGNVPHDYTIDGCVFWQDLYGHALAIGGETYSTQTMSNVKMRDCDVVRATVNLKLSPHDSAVSVWDGQGMVLDGMLVDGLYIENSDRPDVFTFTVLKDKTNLGVGAIRNVTIKNVHLAGEWKPSELSGFDDQHRIENVTFEGLFLDKTPRLTPTDAQVNVNADTANIALLTGKIKRHIQ